MKTEEEIRDKIKVFQNKLPNLEPDDPRFISSETVIHTLKWVLNEV